MVLNGLFLNISTRDALVYTGMMYFVLQHDLDMTVDFIINCVDTP